MTSTDNISNPNDISLRAILIGLVLVVANVYWVAIASELWYCMFTLVNPFSNAIFTLTFLILLGFALGRISKRLSLSSAELLVIYVMVMMGSTISGATTMTPLLGTLTQPFWFASPENEWQRLFWRYIPSWFTTSRYEDTGRLFPRGVHIPHSNTYQVVANPRSDLVIFYFFPLFFTPMYQFNFEKTVG